MLPSYYCLAIGSEPTTMFWTFRSTYPSEQAWRDFERPTTLCVAAQALMFLLVSHQIPRYL